MSRFVLKTPNIQVNITRFAHIHYFEMAKNYTTKPDSHDFYELIYVDKGRMDIAAQGFTGPLLAHQLIIHRPNEVHALSTGDNAPNVIIVGFECSCSQLDGFNGGAFPVSNELQSLLGSMIKEAKKVFLPSYDIPNLKNMYKANDYDFGADQLAKLLTEQFLIMLIRENRRESAPALAVPAVTNPTVLGVLEFIEHNLTRKLTVQEACALCGLNKSTFSALFKQHTGKTFIEYILYAKVEKAKVFLREGQMSITQISELLNFNSVNYFSKVFKERVHLSPKDYANSIKANFS